MNSLTDTAMTEESIAVYLQEKQDFFELHAEMLTFYHPDDGREMTFLQPAPF